MCARSALTASPPFRPMSDMCSRSWLTACPPFRPAARASSLVKRWATPRACAAAPPSLAISRCFSGLIAAKPRFRGPLEPGATGNASVGAPAAQVVCQRRSSAFDCAGREPRNEPLLEEEIEQKHRQADHERGGHQAAPIDLHVANVRVEEDLSRAHLDGG